MLAAVALWSRPAVWIGFLFLAVVCGHASGVLHGPAIFWLLLFAGPCALYVRLGQNPDNAPRLIGKIGAALAIITLAFLLGTHALPGFRNVLVVKDLVISSGAAPYTLYLNFDKAAVGILLGGIMIPRLRTWSEAGLALSQAAPLAMITIAILICASIALGYLHFEPKWHPLFWLWAASNLFFTCLSEEAFFRGFIQRELVSRLKRPMFAVTVSAIVFGLAHAAGGWSYVLLSTLAGFGYGLVYQRTGRLEMAILTHFALNTVHFLLFTYPRLD